MSLPAVLKRFVECEFLSFVMQKKMRLRDLIQKFFLYICVEKGCISLFGLRYHAPKVLTLLRYG